MVKGVSVKSIRDDSTGGDCTSIGTWDWNTRTCILSTDLIDSAIQIDNDEITFDGNGHEVTNLGIDQADSVIISGKSGVVIKDLAVITDSFYVINITWSRDSDVINNEISGLQLVLVNNSNNIKFENNTITTSHGSGIEIISSNHIAIIHNTVKASDNYAISFSDSDNNRITGNEISISYGLPVRMHSSRANRIQDNNVSCMAERCVKLDSSSENNILYFNRFVGEWEYPGSEGEDDGTNNDWDYNYYQSYSLPEQGCNDIGTPDGICDEALSIPGIGGSIDLHPLVSWRELADSDGDSIPDVIDNCPDTSNPGQEDADEDGMGDICEADIYEEPGSMENSESNGEIENADGTSSRGGGRAKGGTNVIPVSPGGEGIVISTPANNTAGSVNQTFTRKKSRTPGFSLFAGLAIILIGIKIFREKK